jgi:hypothetical protein
MGAGDLEVLDILVTTDSDGEPRLKVGDYASGQGVGQDCIFLAATGFVSQPNPPDGSGNCGTAIAWTPGDDRLVIAAIDNRYIAKAGGLSLGDCAIVSNCDAYLKLTQAGNTITLGALAQGLTLSVNAAAQSVGMATSKGALQIGPTGIGANWLPGGGINVAFNMTSTLAELSFAGPAGLAAIVLGVDGSVKITALPGAGGGPQGVTINGQPLVVP